MGSFRLGLRWVSAVCHLSSLASVHIFLAPQEKNFLEAKVPVSGFSSKSFVLTYLGYEMPSLVFRHFKEDPSAVEGNHVWVSAMMLPTGLISPTSRQGVSSLEKVITFIWVMNLYPYFFKYSTCSFHLFFFLGKSTYSLRFSVMVPFFWCPRPNWSVLCNLSVLVSILVCTGLNGDNWLPGLCSPRGFTFLQGGNWSLLILNPQPFSQGLTPGSWSASLKTGALNSSFL